MTHTQAPGTPFISWVHFGDLHIQNVDDENYLDFLDLIADVNQHFSRELDFAFLREARNSLTSVICSVNQGAAQTMQRNCSFWEFTWNSQDVPDGLHSIVVKAETAEGRLAKDEISILVNRAGDYDTPPRQETDYENAIGRYEGKGILGTELGPNEKGSKGPWPSWRRK